MLWSHWCGIGAYVVGLHQHALGACDIIDFGSRCELGTVKTPIRNLQVLNERRNGRREAPPMLFAFVLRGDLESRLRRDALFFRQGGGAQSEAILTHWICFALQKEFLV